MANPPAAVKLALESICLLLGESTTDWKQIRSIIMRENFIPTIVNFSAEEIRWVGVWAQGPGLLLSAGAWASDAASAGSSVGSQVTQMPLQAISTPDSQIPSPPVPDGSFLIPCPCDPHNGWERRAGPGGEGRGGRESHGLELPPWAPGRQRGTGS